MSSTEVITTGVIQIICTTILGLWLKNYLPSYFSQKGKNLADKEDIKELTNSIESVKQEFSHKIESFKSKLSIEQEYIIRHNMEERDAILKYWECISAWNLNIAINKYESYEYDHFFRNPSLFNDLNKCMLNAISAHSILQLKSSNDEILKISRILLQVSILIMNDLSQFQSDVINIPDIDNSHVIFKKYQRDLKLKLDDYHENYNKSSKKFIEVTKKYLSSSLYNYLKTNSNELHLPLD